MKIAQNFLNDYNNAEKSAKTKKVGIHSGKDVGIPSFADLVSTDKRAKKKEFKENLTNKRGNPCVVDHIYSGTRIKLRLESFKCYVPFYLLGIKSFNKDPNNNDIQEKLFNTVVNYSMENILQRDCKCDIINSDKLGNYFGYLFFNDANYSTTLLKEGLAVVQEGTPTIYMNEFKNAEKVAIEQKKNVWKYESIAKSMKDDYNQNVTSSKKISKFESKNKEIVFKVTDYQDLLSFNIVQLPNKTLDQINSLLDGYNKGKQKGVSLANPIRKGTLCLAKFSFDKKYYRATVTNTLKDDMYEVQFIDFGTYENVPDYSLIKIDSSLSLFEPQALLCELAFLKYTKNFSKRAMDTSKFFSNLDKEWTGKIAYSYVQDNYTKLGIIPYNSTKKEAGDSIQSNILALGYAKLDKEKQVDNANKIFIEIESKAEKAGIGLWAENEISDDETEI